MLANERDNHRTTFPFLVGGGECGRLIGLRDWSSTSLGSIGGWPQSLKTAVAILLRSPVPMVMLWGADGIMLYNDAYSVFAGGRHPELLGSKVREGWPEVADFNDHVMKVGLSGGTLAYKDQELTLYRHGRPEQVWMDLDYSPVLDEHGQPAGVLAIVIETTERITSERRLNAERDQQRRALQQMPGFAALLTGSDHRFEYVNDAYVELIGDRDFIGRPVREVLPEVAGQGYYELLDAVFASGRAHVARSNPLTLRGEERFLDFIYHPVRNEDGQVTGIFVGGYDVTEHVRRERAWRESEERFRIAQAAGGIGTFELIPDAGRIVVSDMFCRLWGVPPVKEASVSYFSNLLHPDDRDRVATVRSQLPEHALDYIEYRIIRPDTGETRWMARKGEAVTDETGRARYFGVSYDISDRKAAEEALVVESRNLATLNRTGRALAAELDLERVVQLVTDAGVELTGAKFGAFFYNVLNEAGEAYMLYTLSGADRAQFDGFGMPRATAVFKPTFDGEGVIRSNDILADPRYGRSAPHHGMPKGHLPVRSYLAVPVASRSGEVIGGLFFGHPEPGRFVERHEALMVAIASQAAVAIDNARLYQAAQRANETLERRVAEALAERKLLADIVESTDAFVQIVDLDFKFLGINRASADEFERIYGVRPKVGDNMLDLLAHRPEHRADVEAVWRRALAGEEFTEVGEFGDPVRERRFYEMKFNSLRDGKGRLIGAYQFVYDVTDRLRDQQRLAEAEDALRQSQKMEAVGQLVAGLAHDFNNLLGAVVGSLDLIRRRADDTDRVRRYADAAIQAAERGSKLTGQLLAFSRVQQLELKPLIVCDIIEDMRELLARTLGPMIDLKFDLNPAPVPVLSDETQLETAILNLAINARDAMPEGGRLTISTRLRRIAGDTEVDDGEYVELTVADTGVGMDAATVARALDPFFTTKPVGKGTGLGLSQVYGLARQAGGTLRIESRPGQGTSMHLLLPRTGAMPAGRAGSDAMPDATSGPAPAKILVIDDDDAVRVVLVESLEMLGFNVIDAADGSSGLTMFEAEKPDLMILDYAMPGLTGAEVAKAARRHRPGMPIMFVSGYADTAAINEALGEEPILIRKPFRIDELRASIYDLIKA